MALENKLGITNSAELAREEERISKKKAVELFESGSLDKLAPGRFASLQAIHIRPCALPQEIDKQTICPFYCKRNI